MAKKKNFNSSHPEIFLSFNKSTADAARITFSLPRPTTHNACIGERKSRKQRLRSDCLMNCEMKEERSLLAAIKKIMKKFKNYSLLIVVPRKNENCALHKFIMDGLRLVGTFCLASLRSNFVIKMHFRRAEGKDAPEAAYGDLN